MHSRNKELLEKIDKDIGESVLQKLDKWHVQVLSTKLPSPHPAEISKSRY